MNEEVYALINHQINEELYSAYLYLSFADYYEQRGLKGYANWYFIQVQEERDHALIFRNYLIGNDRPVKLEAVAAPDKTFDNDLAPLEAALEHEKYITGCINKIYAAAQQANDFRTMNFLTWFVQEQMEEEDNARTMVSNMKLFGSDPKGLYDLDQAALARVYTQAAPLATA